MANIINNNFHNLKLKVNSDEYWDFFINKDSFSSYFFSSDSMYDKCLISYIDASLDECIVDNEWLYGMNKYQWESAISSDYTLYNIGYTGVDNGLIRYRKDRISNEQFLKIYSESKFDIHQYDKTLRLHQVSGNTLQYEYPTEIKNGVIKLNGGFYQGFFETQCNKYKVLPNTIDSDWHLEFILKKEDFIKESDKTLNDKYPENKGIFFYIGTRAENKWIYLYDDSEDECSNLSPDNYVEDAKINKKDYIIGNFYDPNPDFNGFDRFNMDNYLNYKYFSDEIYNNNGLDECDFTMDDYIDFNDKPNIIDEENNKFITLGCCNVPVSNISTPSSNITKNCGCIGKIDNKTSNKSSVDDEFYGGCSIFGDDYISDFEDLDDGTDYLEGELDISDFQYELHNGLKLKLANQYYFESDNKFLLFDRTCNGFTVNNWVDGTKVMFHGIKHRFKGNLFLLMNRTCTGYTVDNIHTLIEKDDNQYNIYKDLYNNALAFQITDDGKIGYRYLVLDCESENNIKLLTGYSNPNIIKSNEWSIINIRIKPFAKTIKIYFYVNGKLVYITNELPMLNLRELDEIYDKQEGVPYNISLGGGSQGLAETIQPNYMLLPSKVFPIEKYFAGTFIGYLKSFKFYTCHMEYMNIMNNFKYEINKLN
jgi:hypothetical protein